jgi:hypothetical protein
MNNQIENTEPALDPTARGKVVKGSWSGEAIAEVFDYLADQARKFNAETMDSTIGYVSESDETDGEYIPEIVMRVRRSY